MQRGLDARTRVGELIAPSARFYSLRLCVSALNFLFLALNFSSPQKNTKERTTTFLRQRAVAGAVGSTQAVWKDQRETVPSVTLS